MHILYARHAQTQSSTVHNERYECSPADSAHQYNWKKQKLEFWFYDSIINLVAYVLTLLCYYAPYRKSQKTAQELI